MKIQIPISIGELLDKISILQIKSQFTDSPYVIKEKEYLIQIAKENDVYKQEFLNKLLDVKMLLFDGSIEHHSVTSTDHPRCVININYLK